MATRKKLVLKYLQSIYPENATNSDIVVATGIEPHQQVFQKTSELRTEGLIEGWREGNTWHFRAKGDLPLPATPERKIITPQPTGRFTPKEFEMLARQRFAAKFDATLLPGKVDQVNKEWDMISPDGQVVGDAKYYTMVRGKGNPSAKLATISEHVWLLEKTSARVKFLVFGNQQEVPKTWLRKYGNLVTNVEFYFLDDDGNITRLK
ncbi:MAG: hypothetical protein ISR58_19685 [Anaerolineales bacterium]|nr:hypothetical protein [Chloroflexota bacterium]MBL6983407.1 hypothetical protein [Anaerolineales bacterium]